MADIEKTPLIRNPLVLGGVAIVIVAAAVGGYFLLKPAAPKLDAHGKPIPSLCAATLARAVEYGLVESDTKLASADAGATAAKSRMICKARLGSEAYTLTVDVACDNVSDEKCLKLYSVTDTTGNSLFQRQM